MKLTYTLAAIAATTLAANAATVTTSYGTVTGGDDSNQAGPIYGQSITANVGVDPVATYTDLYLTKFEYQASGGGVGTGVVYLQAYDDFAVDTDGNITALGNLVDVSTSTLDLGTIAGHGNMSWDFGGAAAFDAASDYTFLMSTVEGAQTVGSHAGLVTGNFDLNTGDPYAGGQAFIANTFGDIATWDLEFKATWDTTAAVPEPSSAALLGLGGLALILRRRK